MPYDVLDCLITQTIAVSSMARSMVAPSKMRVLTCLMTPQVGDQSDKRGIGVLFWPVLMSDVYKTIVRYAVCLYKPPECPTFMNPSQ